MAKDAFRSKIEGLFGQADIAIDGSRPWDVCVHNSDFYARLLAGGSLALGESFMDGWWDCPRLDEFFFRLLHSRIDQRVRSRRWLFTYLKAKLLNLQKPSRAFQVGERHYDIGNDLYRRMLDKRMVYSCAYWTDGTKTLDQAQDAKLDLICRKLRLEPGMRLLDIGCGWGGMAQYAAEHYGVDVVGLTVSREQATYARELCDGLPVHIRLQDYRDIDETFDRIVSIGMFEHVGAKNYRTFMNVARRCLKDQGLMLLHTIGSNRSVSHGDAWLETYIFTNGMLPSSRQICAAAEGLFVLEDWHSFGPNYDKTLMHWHRNISAHWDELGDSYDQRFRRMWTYYLLSCAASFRARRNQLWQIVYSPKGVPGGYQPPRYGDPT